MRTLIPNPRWAFLLLLVLVSVAVSGCATAEPDNVSEKPWNSPQGWETGLPSGMFNQSR